MKKKGVCQLCGQERELIKSSHIIPEFMYKPLFDADRQMHMRSLTRPGDNGKTVQTGIYDKHILCEDCDNRRIGQMEQYVAAVLFGGHAGSVTYQGSQNPDGSHSIKMAGLDYRKFKLFFLSVLWRAHISKNKFFEKINIGSTAAIIRDMLLSEDPDKESRFRVSVMVMKGRSGDLVRLLPTPELKILGEGAFAMFFINGFLYFVDLEPASDFVLFKNFYLRESGQLEILILDGKRANDLLRGLGIAPEMADFFTDPGKL